MADTPKKRPVYRNIHVTDLASYRLPPAGVVSILHRISGVVMFLLLPLIIWAFDTSVSTDVGYANLTDIFTTGAFYLPGWCFKLVALGIVWAYLHHFTAGVRHLYMDATHSVTKEFGHSSALATFGFSLALTAAVAAKLFFF